MYVSWSVGPFSVVMDRGNSSTCCMSEQGHQATCMSDAAAVQHICHTQLHLTVNSVYTSRRLTKASWWLATSLSSGWGVLLCYYSSSVVTADRNQFSAADSASRWPRSSKTAAIGKFSKALADRSGADGEPIGDDTHGIRNQRNKSN